MSNAHPAQKWQPGQSGNPAGRKVGSRNKLCERYFDDIYPLWEQYGVAILECLFKAATTDPHLAAIVNRATITTFPKQLQVQSSTTYQSLSVEELKQIVSRWGNQPAAASDSAGSTARAVAPLGSDKPDSVH
jgi:hypothetical protein